jgi:hypothetical protein
MKKKQERTGEEQKVFFVLCSLLLSLCCSALYAQDRSKLSVYVPLPEGGTAQQKEYFQTNFKMELIGANYPSTETRAESAYTLLLTIQDNPDFVPTAATDGVTSWDDNQLKPFELGIKLVHSDNDEEVVSFSFLFDTIESMNEWNLYLLYQALANAYVGDGAPPPPAPEADDRWRNQTFYLNIGAGADLGFFLRSSNGQIDTGIVVPALLLGLEWHILNFLSVELDVKPRLMENYAITAAAALTARAVFKPSTVMLELYGGLEYAYALDISVPPLSMLAGFQLGFQGAPRSAWVLDIGFTRYITGTVHATNGKDYSLSRIHLLAGFKFGFRDRKAKNKEPEAADGSNEP